MELNKKKKITKRRYRAEQPDALTPALSHRERENTQPSLQPSPAGRGRKKG